MTRYSQLRRLALLAGLVAAGVLGLSAVPSGATVICPPGITPPSKYCSNVPPPVGSVVPPTATTLPATRITGTGAQLNGIAGPNVQGGLITQYFFQYGTKTSYGKQTPTRTIGTCPPGISSPNAACNVPKTQLVSADISKLTPCTTYHFRVVATNPNGAFNGADQDFKTTFANPLTNVTSPSKVKANKKFTVKFELKYDAKSAKIFIKNKHGSVVKTSDYGSEPKGKHSKSIVAPKNKGDYKVEVFAKLGCGQQEVTKNLKVQ